jgi:hypothetical protein
VLLNVVPSGLSGSGTIAKTTIFFLDMNIELKYRYFYRFTTTQHLYND